VASSLYVAVDAEIDLNLCNWRPRIYFAVTNHRCSCCRSIPRGFTVNVQAARL